MLIYKVLRAGGMGRARGRAARALGAPVDRADGYVHFSTAGQLAGTLAKHFAGETGLVLLAVEAERGGRGAPLGAVAGRGALRASLPARLRWRTCSGRGRSAEVDARRRWNEPRRAPGPAAAPAARPGDGARAGAGGAAGGARDPGARPARLAAARARGWPGWSSPTRSGWRRGSTRTPRRWGRWSRRASASSRSGRRRRCRSRATRGRGSSGWREDRAVINRFGFNNDGVAAIAARLAARPPGGVVGLNLGANKASADRAADYAAVLAAAGPFVDFATVNVSSPNTERLRDLQGRGGARAGSSPGSWRRTARWRGRCRSSSRSRPTSARPSSRRWSRWRWRRGSPASSPPTPPSPATG